MKVKFSNLCIFGFLLFIFLFSVSHPISTAVAASPYPWPMVHQNPQMTGRTITFGPNIPEIKWTLPDGPHMDNRKASVAIADDGTIYMGSTRTSGDSPLRAINPNGTVKWTVNLPGSLEFAPALADDGTIYIGSKNGTLFAVNPDSTIKWSLDMGASIVDSVMVGSDGTVYVPTTEHMVSAVNPTGNLLWSYDDSSLDCPCNASTAALASDGSVYVMAVNINSYLYALTPTGSFKWRVYIWGSTTNVPSVATDGTIYITGYGGTLHAIMPDGSYKWAYGTGEINIVGSAAIGADGAIYVGTSGIGGPHFGKLFAVNPDGTTRWVYGIGSYLNTAAIIDGAGTIYIAGDQAGLYAFNPDGTLKWSGFSSGLATPAIGKNGTIYHLNSSGTLQAIGASNEAPSINPLANATIDQRDMYAATGSFTDPDSASWTATVDFADGSGQQPLSLSNGGFTLNYQYTETGVFTVTVRVMDDEGATGTQTAMVTVTAPVPTVSLTADPDTIIAGESTTLSWNSTDATACESADFYTTGATSGTVGVSPTETTAYTITCTGQGGETATAATVTVIPQLTAAISTTPPEGNAPLTVAFIGTAAGGIGDYTFSWDFGDDTTDTVQNPSHTYAGAGTYPVLLTVTSGTQMATATLTVNVTEPLIGPPTDKEQCKKGGWQTFNNPSFKNQGDCVSYVATHGKNQPAGS